MRSLDRGHLYQACCVLAVLFILMVRSVVADDSRRVLILYGYESGRNDTIGIDAGIRRVLRSEMPDQLEIYSEYLDLQRFPETAQFDREAVYLHDKFAGRQIDLVIAGGSPAIRFLAQHRSLFPKSRLMFSGATESPYIGLLDPKVSGVTNKLDPVPTATLALRLQPDTKRIVVVMGNTPTDKDWQVRARKDLAVFTPRINIEYWIGLSTSDLLRKAAELRQGTIVLYLGFGDSFNALVRQLALAAGVPVYAEFEDYTGLGIVGGSTSTYDEIGRDAGEIAVQILTRHASGIRVTPTSTDIVDWRQLQRWGLDEANLPPGTTVRFRPPSLWEEHKWAVMGAVAALALQAILIAALIVQARRRQRAQAVLELQQQELAHLGRVSLLGELSGAIGHEINNPLTAILSNAQAGKRFLERDPPDTGQAGEIFDDIAADSKRAGNVIQRLRALFKKADAQLEPVDLNGIVAEVLQLADRRLLEDNVSVTTKLASDLPTVRADSVQLKQVLLNLVVNACDAMTENKPGDRSLTIATSCEDKGFAQVSVSDRGSGIAAYVKERLFQPFVTTKSTGTGLGLSICRSIIEAHGGRLSASNNPDSGATFSVALPIGGHRSQTVTLRSEADVRIQTSS